DGGLAHRDVERRESLRALHVQRGATIDEKLHDAVGATVRGAVERRFAPAVRLTDVEADVDEYLQRLQRVALAAARVLVAIPDTGREHQRGISVLRSQLRVRAAFEEQPGH